MSYADEWRISSGVNQNISYDDNVRMREDAEASLIYEISPNVELIHRTDVSEVVASARYGFQRYFDISELDRNNQSYGIVGQYISERFDWRLASNYGITPARDVAVQQSGDFSTNADKKTFSISPSISYKWSELDSFLLSGSYTDTRYSTDDLESVGNLRDYVDKGLNVSWIRQWTERYNSSLQLFYSNYKPFGEETENFNNSVVQNNSYGLNLSSTYEFSEKWQFSGTIGFRGTETIDQTTIGNQRAERKSSSFGYLLDSTINYSGESYSALFNVNQSLVPSSQGRLNEQLKFSFDTKYALTERLSAQLVADYQESQAVDNVNSIKRTNYTVNPSINWRIHPDWTLSTSYRYRYQKRPSGAIEEEAHSNLYMLTVNYRWQGLSIAR